MNPWIPHLLRAGGGGGGPVLPPAGRTMLANLKSSLILDEGTGDPTWSRATKAWGFNELGYLVELASGCAFFGGARLVRSTVRTKSEDFSNAAWVKTNLTVTGTNVLVCSNSTADNSLNQVADSSVPTIAGQYFRYSIRAKRVSGGVGFVQIGGSSYSFGATAFCTFSLTDGTYAAQTGVTASVTQISSDTYDFSVRLLCTTTTTNSDVFYVSMQNGLSDTRKQLFVGDGVKSFELLRAWSVDVTGYDASYVPEYVSVGVLSSPYHGAGTTSTADGCKYFETDWQGAPLPAASLLGFRREAAATNNLLWSRNLAGATWTQLGSLPTPKAWVPTTIGSSVVSNGTFDTDLAGWTNNGSATASVVSGKMRIDGTAGTGGRYQDLTLAVGKTYLITGGITSISGSGTLQCVIYATAALSGAVKAQQYTASNTVAIIFTATATTQRIYCSVAASTVADFDDIAVTECSCAATTATGLDGIANTATTLTATAADATILQPITLASAARCASAYVKRRTGTGTISFTQDGGGSWTDITAQINGSTWSRVQITSTLANPSVGFKIGTSGDAIDVDCVQNEAGTVATSPIVTTTAAVTRNADSDTYQTASNWSDTAGTVYIEAQPLAWVAGGAIGSATNGLLLSAANSGATASDGTNTANGPIGTPSGRKKMALRWTGSTMDVSVGGVIGTAGTYDGAMGLASLGIAVNSSGYFGPSAAWNYAMTDDEFKALTT